MNETHSSTDLLTLSNKLDTLSSDLKRYHDEFSQIKTSKSMIHEDHKTILAYQSTTHVHTMLLLTIFVLYLAWFGWLVHVGA